MGEEDPLCMFFCDWIIVPSGFGKRDNPVKQADLWIFMTGPADLWTEGGHSQDKIKDQSECEDCRTATWINQSQHAAEGPWGPDVCWVWLCFEWLQKEGLLKAIQEGVMHAPATQSQKALRHPIMHEQPGSVMLTSVILQKSLETLIFTSDHRQNLQCCSNSEV